jgi:hypothetical protein
MADLEDQLADEYLFLQKTYEDFDNRALSIKGWCITISLGAVALGFDNTGISNTIWVFVALSAALFWLIEAKWKTFQYANSYRIRVLEAHFRGDEDFRDLPPFQIYNSWFRAYSEDPPVHNHENRRSPRGALAQTARNALLPVVFLPYLPLIIASAIGTGFN